MASAAIRPTMSVEPPAPKGTIMVIVRSGYFCADAGMAASMAADAIKPTACLNMPSGMEILLSCCFGFVLRAASCVLRDASIAADAQAAALPHGLIAAFSCL